ncbi:MAG: GTP-binding protein [Actinomycetota bacterium]
MSAHDHDVVFAPWDGRRVPVTLLGGYLGAGKTTVLNELLARTDRPIAVLVNDVGAVNIDAALIAKVHGDTIELTDGCVCCSLAGGLADAFDGLRSRSTPPDHVVIELSGVADPRRVMPWASSPGFRLDGVVVIIDTTTFAEREADPSTGPHVRAQVEAADLLVLSKLDLADLRHVDEVKTRLAELAPETAVVRGGPSAAAGMLDAGTRRAGDVAITPPATLFDAHRTWTVPLPAAATVEQLHRLVADLPPDVVRAKGVADGADGGRLLIQVVGSRVAIEPLPAAEDQRATDLVVIAIGD